MSKFNVFNDDDIKKQPDEKPRIKQQPEERIVSREVRPPREVTGRINDSDFVRGGYTSQPSAPPQVYLTLERLLSFTLGMPNDMEVIVDLGDGDTLTLLRPIVGNRYNTANSSIEFVATTPNQPLRLQSLRALSRNSTDLSMTFRVVGHYIVRAERTTDGSQLILFT